LIDFRYHITSLVAVFVALALGIIIGSGLVGGPSVQKQNSFIRQQIRSIQVRFNALTQEMKHKDDDIRRLESELERSEELAHAMMPDVLRERLYGRNVAIIQTGDYKDAAAAAQSALKTAGANITSVTRIVLPKEARNDGSLLTADVQNRLDELPSMVANVVANAGNLKALETTADDGLLVLSGDYKRWNRLVVIVGGANSESQKLEVLEGSLIQELKTQGVTVVGCEPIDAKVSSIPTYQKERISTIDNIDRAAGQVALAFALSGEKNDYGVKKTANRFLPRSIEASRSR
jgi:hypothetical protein